MSKVAVIAHAGKTLGGGLPEFRRELERQGVADPVLVRDPEEPSMLLAQVERALEAGAELIFVWGGDGTVQRCIDAAAGSQTALAIMPAGTANLLATNLEMPHGDRARRSRSGSTASGAGSTSAASTASGSA